MKILRFIMSLFAPKETPKTTPTPPGDFQFGYFNTVTGHFYEGYILNGKMKYRRKGKYDLGR